jgi:hypothetical protein
MQGDSEFVTANTPPLYNEYMLIKNEKQQKGKDSPGKEKGIINNLEE